MEQAASSVKQPPLWVELSAAKVYLEEIAKRMDREGARAPAREAVLAAVEHIKEAITEFEQTR